MTTSDWLTWEQAAELVGCPVPTIDWYKRQGRIMSRGRRARSLQRASVEEFAVRWRAREERRAARRAVPRTIAVGPPDPVGWVSSRQAAERLGVAMATVLHRVEHGRLAGTWHGTRLWVRVEDLEEHAIDEARWVSSEEAARVIGCSSSKVGALAREGVIARRVAPSRMPSLDRASVEAFAESEAGRALRRRAAAAPAGPDGPPDDGQVWLDAATTAVVLGLSSVRVHQLAREERLPFTPSPTVAAPAVAQTYGSVLELRDAAIAAGYVCKNWKQDNAVTLAAEAGTCDGNSVLTTYASDTDLQAQLDQEKENTEMLTSAGIKTTPVLVGANWLIKAREAADLRAALGGIVIGAKS